MKKFCFMFICFFTGICVSVVSLGYSLQYTWSTLIPSMEVANNSIQDNADDLSNQLGLDCGSCILIEQSTGQILYSYNCHEKLAPASVTKLMSIYLIMEAISSRKNKL